jgi:hypothetical protein
MRIWFSQVPAYSRRTDTLFYMTWLVVFVVIGAVLPLFSPFREVRYPGIYVAGISVALILIAALVGRIWARKEGVPFVPVRDRRAQQLAWLSEKRPLANTLAEEFCKAFLMGLGAWQANGHPFWESSVWGWMVIISMAIAWVVLRLMAPPPP